ncbi:holo-[acyl-carrier protein] synthase [Lebetimonas natsushimae]|uniref:Holo-[acyl-carrier-protein] synthase n=1 Tax=Lebetimonas natsushimae TaxID=1936991 RepID=A0A292YE53_9BACT|nr:holo-ACP synthase [Lebetimonas natsushimae]GAX87583.1 holo-[acyl-carrier protein] synthase [Lebetimonas natsushimae]
MIGIDIVVISRIENMIKKYGNKVINKILTQEEQIFFKTPSSIAGAFAAKEAFSKALGTGIGKECGFHDIIILKNNKNKPYISQKTLKKFNLKQADISISHDGGFAIAAVIIFQ